MDKCPCLSGKDYDECCEKILSCSAKALTAEALMRARYSAYVVGNIDFLTKSCIEDEKSPGIDVEATKRWSENSKWYGLKILRTEKGGEADSEGVVEFVASYSQKQLKEDYHEIASFKKVDGEWKYDSGQKVPTTIVREGKKTGRNDLCICGSGKKYKKCCGK